MVPYLLQVKVDDAAQTYLLPWTQLPVCRFTWLRLGYKIIDHDVRNTKKKHTTLGIRWSSPTQLLIQRFAAWRWGSGRDPVFSTSFGRMWRTREEIVTIFIVGGQNHHDGWSMLGCQELVLSIKDEMIWLFYVDCWEQPLWWFILAA